MIFPFEIKDIKAFLVKTGAAGVLLAWVINLQLQVNNLQNELKLHETRTFDLQSTTIKENTKSQSELKATVELLTAAIKNK